MLGLEGGHGVWQVRRWSPGRLSAILVIPMCAYLFTSVGLGTEEPWGQEEQAWSKSGVEGGHVAVARLKLSPYKVPSLCKEGIPSILALTDDVRSPSPHPAPPPPSCSTKV